MRRAFLLAALLAAPPALILPALAQTPMVEVTHPWARATPGHATTGAVYLTLTDHGAADSLTGLSTPVADMAMMHESRTENGVAKMVMLDSVALPPHTAVTFRPGAMHIMLTGLKQPLQRGASFPLTLTFAHSGAVTVSVPVMAAGAAGPDGSATATPNTSTPTMNTPTMNTPAAGHDMKSMPGMKMD